MANQQVYDVIVVGGGILGTAVARDCAMRRLSVLLIEREDIGSGATRTILPLMDAGHRAWARNFLPELNHEFDILERLAPHLFQEIPFFFPGDKKYSKLGQKRLSSLNASYQKRQSDRHDRRLREYDSVSWRDRLAGFPLPGGGIESCQSIWDPARFAVLNAKAAVLASASLMNGATVDEVVSESNRVVGVRVSQGRASEFIHAKHVVLTVGAWRNRIRGTPMVPLRNQKETALILDGQLPGGFALTGREATVFWLPLLRGSWLGNWSSPHAGSPDDWTLSGDLPSLMLQTAGIHLPEAFPAMTQITRVNATFEESVGDSPQYLAQTGFLSPVYEPPALIDHQSQGVAGLYTLIGGNGGMARRSAERVTDLIATQLKMKEDCRTAFESLPGGTHELPVEEEAQRTGLAVPVVFQMMRRYGYHAADIFKLMLEDAALARTICPCLGVSAAEVFYVQREEWANSANKVMARTGMDVGCRLRHCRDTLSLWLGHEASAYDLNSASSPSMVAYRNQMKWRFSEMESYS